MKTQKRTEWIRQILATCILAMGILMSLMAMTTLAETQNDFNALPLASNNVENGSPYGEDIIGDPGGKTMVESLANLIGGVRAGDGGIVGRLRSILAAMAIAMVVYSGLKMLMAQGEEGDITKAKKGIYMGLIGLAVVSLAGEFTKILSVNQEAAKAVFKGDNVLCQWENTILGGSMKEGISNVASGKELLCRVNFFNSAVKMIITFMKYLISAIAVYEIVTNGYRIITLGSESSNLERDKKNLIFGSVGLLIIIFSEGLISKVFYQLNFKTYNPINGVQPRVDVSEGIRQLVGFTNIAVSVLGPIAILILVGASIMYMTSGGEEEKQTTARRAIVAAAIGVLVIYGAFGIVSTVISGQFNA